MAIVCRLFGESALFALPLSATNITLFITFLNNLHELNVLHPYNDHESEVIGRSLISTSSLVDSESEEGHDGHNGIVFDNDEATANNAVIMPQRIKTQRFRCD